MIRCLLFHRFPPCELSFSALFSVIKRLASRLRCLALAIRCFAMLIRCCLMLSRYLENFVKYCLTLNRCRASLMSCLIRSELPVYGEKRHGCFARFKEADLIGLYPERTAFLPLGLHSPFAALRQSGRRGGKAKGRSAFLALGFRSPFAALRQGGQRDGRAREKSASLPLGLHSPFAALKQDRWREGRVEGKNEFYPFAFRSPCTTFANENKKSRNLWLREKFGCALPQALLGHCT